MPLIVFSEPGRARTREPLAKRTESLVSLSSLTFLSTRARNSENLSMSSWDCLSEGESRTMVLRGLWMASHSARMAVMVDLPDCLEQLRIILWCLERRNRACQGSGSNLR